LPLTNIGVGSYSYHAVFTPTDAALFTSSTSANLALTVTAAPPVQVTTTTALTMAPSAATAVAPAARTLTAAVTGANAAGTVQFFNGTTSLGTSPVASGSATLPLTNIGVGSYSYHAVFTPTDAALFTSSTSANLAFTVTASTPLPSTAFIRQLSPGEGRVGAKVEIEGTGFGTAGVVQFGTANARVLSWSAKKIVVIVPSINSVSVDSDDHAPVWYRHDQKVLVTVTPEAAAPSNGVEFDLKSSRDREHDND
jgi:hypothetical protein